MLGSNYVINILMRDTIFLVGYIIAIAILVLHAYRMRVLGFKSYFHNLANRITEVVGGEKGIFYKINAYCLIVFGLLAPIILFAFPLFEFVDHLEVWETASDFEIRAIGAIIIYFPAMIAGFCHVIYILCIIWKFRKDQKMIK